MAKFFLVLILFFISSATAFLECKICSIQGCCLALYNPFDNSIGCTSQKGTLQYSFTLLPTFSLGQNQNLFSYTFFDGKSSYSFNSIVLPNQTIIADGFQDTFYFSANTNDQVWSDLVNVSSTAPYFFCDSVWGCCQLSSIPGSCSVPPRKGTVTQVTSKCFATGYILRWEDPQNYVEICASVTSTSIFQEWNHLQFPYAWMDEIQINCRDV